MIVIKKYHNNTEHRYNVAIGNFDGIHKGHKFLINKLLELKKTELDKIALLTFHPHPVKVIYPEKWKKNIIRFRTKFRLLQKSGIDALFIIAFNEKFRNLSSKDFIENILIKGIKAKNVLVGEDFKFGKNREGSIEDLQSHSIKRKFNLYTFKKIDFNGEIFSSSSIRNYLKIGEIEKCNRLLGYYWEVEDKVIKGEARGRLLGFPTANMNYNYQISPSNGIYACWVKIEKEKIWRMAAISSGIRPHYKGEKKILEIHILDYEGNLYNKRLRVAFIKKIRNEEKFESEEKLIQQMKKDCIKVISVLKENSIKNDNYC